MGLEILTDLIGLHWILLLSIVLAILYQTGFRYRSFFSDKGVPYLPGVPLLGSQSRFLLGKENLFDAYVRYYNAFPGKRFFGMFEVTGTPVYVIRDPELMKQIGIKDFDHFANHRTFVSQDLDPLLGRSLFVMRGDRWREMRSTLSPAFTGSKMRLMLGLVNEVGEQFVKHIKNDAGNGKEYDLRDLFTRFASDSIATSAFGLQLNSLADRDNKFYKTGLVVTNFDGIQGLKFLFYQSVPRLMKWLRVRFFSPEHTEFFRDLVHGNMKYREEHQVVRHDMINLMMLAKGGKLTHSIDSTADEKDIGFATVEESEVGKSKRITKFEDDDLVAQCMIFFLAGFNAVSLSQCFMGHEMTVNPDIQSKLYAEIAKADRELNGKPLSYETLQSLKYLDQVVSETMRRWTLASINDRLVDTPITIQNDDGSSVQLNVGDGIVFPINGLHMDPKYYPDPERFDPERFSDENKHNIQPGTYLPFGIGPRNCIGSRFALMGIKILFYHLLLNFSLEKSAKTQHPIKLKQRYNPNMLPEVGFYAELRPRTVGKV